MPATPLHHARRLAITTAALLGALAAAGPAGAASPPVTRQALAADAAFLAYAPPPPGGAGTLCLVDTGVTKNPDTTPGLLLATALDGGTGDDVDPLKHGTIDAAIAGGSGAGGVLGAWPQLKIISVRSTDVPSPGQEPEFQFDSYSKGITECIRPRTGVPPIYAIDLPLSSVIPPSPDQTAALNNSLAQAQTARITVLAAAGNSPGPVQLPASQGGIFAVGAGDLNGGVCSFSASAGLTFFAPGCGIDTIDPNTDVPKCCGNGTSQASAFTAGVLVALRSYDTALTPATAAQLLLSTTVNGHLDVAAAFRAAGLGAIVDAGNAAIPKPPPAPMPAPTPAPSSAAAPNTGAAAPTVPAPLVRSVTWRRGVLRVALASIAAGERLHVKLTFAHHKARYYATTHRTLSRHTPRPQRVLLHLTAGSAVGATVTVKF